MWSPATSYDGAHGRLAGAEAAGDAPPPGLGEQLATPEQGDKGPDEEPGDHDVEARGQRQEEREAAHRTDREDVEQHGADEAGDVGGDDRAEGPLPAPLG